MPNAFTHGLLAASEAPTEMLTPFRKSLRVISRPMPNSRSTAETFGTESCSPIGVSLSNLSVDGFDRWAGGKLFVPGEAQTALSFLKSLVRKGGLEPPRFYPPDPKSGASANSATFALCSAAGICTELAQASLRTSAALNAEGSPKEILARLGLRDCCTGQIPFQKFERWTHSWA